MKPMEGSGQTVLLREAFEPPETVPALLAHLRTLSDELPADFAFPGLTAAIDQYAGDFGQLLHKIAGFTRLDESAAIVVMDAPMTQRFSPKQSAFLLAHSFYGNVGRLEGCGNLSWLTLYCSLEQVAPQRLLCLFDYFDAAEDNFDRPGLELERVSFHEWPWKDELVLEASHVTVHDERMEEHSRGGGFMDFANKRLMIHRIIASLTQEEVLFSACSELFLTLLCVPILADGDAMLMRHCWRHCDYRGYMDTFCYAGPLEGGPERWTEEVVAIDALTHHHFVHSVRDLQKAYVGMAAAHTRDISTGKWGCGVFGGDTSHKFLQQLMAAQLAGKTLHYSSYKTPAEKQRYLQLVELIGRAKPSFGWLLSQFAHFPRMQGRGFHDWICARLEELAPAK